MVYCKHKRKTPRLSAFVRTRTRRRAGKQSAEGGDPGMENRLYGNQYRTTLVCIDEYADGVPAGQIRNPYFSGGRQFHGLMRFLQLMEDLLDATQLPQSFTAARTFGMPPARPPTGATDASLETGQLATFALRVMFRQNASWQGSVTWLETGREESFRSVLELLLMMDGALRERGPGRDRERGTPATPSRET